jgi:hypothetical protein
MRESKLATGTQMMLININSAPNVERVCTRVTSSMHALREPYGTLLLQQVLGRVRVMSPTLVHACMHELITTRQIGQDSLWFGGGRD